MSLSAGQRLGPYEILAAIGAGGMGEVYKARDARLNREVAVKVLPEHLADDPQALARFEREGKAVAALSHPNILVLYDVGSLENVHYAVTELLEGESLRERLSRGPLPWRKVAEFGAAVAQGLAAAHSKRIVHQDIKPANIFLTADGRVKILDFGLAQIRNAPQQGEETQTLIQAGPTLIGTIGYMSPEQVRGEQATAASDIFSLGCVLYEMVTGRRAFSGQSATDTMAAILKEDPPALADSGKPSAPELDRVIERCLAKNPQLRFHSAHDLAFALESLSTSSGQQRPAPGTDRRRRASPPTADNAGSNHQLNYRFAGFSLDAERGALLRGGREVKLRPKVYDALRYFVENRGRLIAKEELIEALWPDAFVTEDSLVQCLVELRRALDDRDQEILKTVPRRGYLFAADVTAHGAPSEPLAEPGEPALERVTGRYYLPLPRTPLIGRERELAGVKNLLLDPTIRLITLTGAGGSGKTRLALQVAAELVAPFESRVYFVALASLADPDMVAPTIAESIGIRQTGGRPFPDLLKEHLREIAPSPLLLLLDNFEHILPASSLVVDLLEASATLKILVTSQAALRVYGEHEFPVPPLALPEFRQVHSPEALLRNPAVALFSQRAAAVKPDFTLTADNASAVAEICSRLDGLPLAIELAAARVKMLSPNAMLARLQSRLELLTAGARDLPERQQTLRKTIDWSYGLLTEAEQKLLRRMGVFLGGCTLEAAEAVGDTRGDLGAGIFDVMASLVDKSLILQTEHGSDEPRFAMLETIREYCIERLAESGEATPVRRAHAAYCLVLAEEGNPELEESARAAWLARCDIEHDNFRAALDWLFQTGDLAWAFRLCLALFRFWDMREHLAEARARLETTLRLSGPEYAKERGKVSHYLSAITTTLGDFPAATHYAEQSLSIYQSLDDQWGIAVSMNACAIIARDRGDYAASQQYFEQNLSYWRALGDRVAVARCLYNLANLVKGRGDYARARAVLQEAAQIFVDLGDRSGAAWSLSQQGDIAREQGDAAAARDLYQHALSAFRHAGDRWGIARSLTDLGYVACDQGDYVTAHAAYREGLDIFTSLEHKRGIARALEGFACSAWARGIPERALAIAAAATHLRQSISAPLLPLEQTKFDRNLQAARKSLEEQDGKSAWEHGWAMPLEAAIRYALEDADSATSV